ncbi:interferon a3-like [Engraulis encrasicolus]|uniref:interferon a3-like n=1 Tax=Engraulis encrasicolus TaxID=184585 RepID=UPI002FD7678B
MASQSCPLLLCLLVLWAAQLHSMPTPCHLQGALLQKVNDLLQDMGGHYPLECLDENVNLTFPASAFKSNSTAAQVEVGIEEAAYEVLRNMDVLFENDTMPSGWDQAKLDDFRNIVYRLVEENQCVSGTEKEHSTCAWEVVRKETSRTLKFILKTWTTTHRPHARG